MKTFFEAFTTFQESTQFYTDVDGRLFLDEASQKTPLPYAVFSFPFGTPEYDLTGKETENMTAQLDIYEKRASDIMNLFDEANDSFNGASFSVYGYQLIGLKRITQRRLKEDKVRRYIIEFSIQIGEN